jgi:hypothetical protein
MLLLKRVIVVLLVGALLLVTANASARRTVHGRTKKSILQAEVPSGVPAPLSRCERVWLSTVRGGRSWALDLTVGDGRGACAHYQPGDYAFLHLVGAKWRIVHEGDELGCPPYPIKRVPLRIERDLAGCSG